MYVGLRKKPAYFALGHYGYMSRPNSVDAQYRVEAFDRLVLPQALAKAAKGIHDSRMIESSAVGARLLYGAGVRQVYHAHEF